MSKISKKSSKISRTSTKNELAFQYYNDLGPRRDLPEVARYMGLPLATIQKWAADADWEGRVDNSQPMMSRLRYSAMQLEQVVREEVLREINFLYSSVEQLLMTMFKKDEDDEFILREDGSYVLEDYLKISNIKDLKSIIQCFKELSDLKLTAVTGIGAQDKSDIIRAITEKREREGWDVFRTMRECEIVIGKVPEFLKQEAMILKAKEAEEHGDVIFEISGETDDIEEVSVEMVSDSKDIGIKTRKQLLN